MIEKFFKSLWYRFWNIFEYITDFSVTLITLFLSGWGGIEIVLLFDVGFFKSVFIVLAVVVLSLLATHIWIKQFIKPLIPKNKKKKRRRDVLNEWLDETA